jgi:hypothetical protein
MTSNNTASCHACRRWHFKGMRQHGAVIGVELKKRLLMASRRQGEAEFYIFSLASNFPFLQVGEPWTMLCCIGL